MHSHTYHWGNILANIRCANHSIPPSPLPTAIGDIPSSGTLAHVGVTGKEQETKEGDTGGQDTSQVLSIGAGLPPVPKTLIKRIQAEEFIDMSELLPDCLGINAGMPLKGEKDKKWIKRRQVANILEWLECFSIFTAVCTQKHPEKTQDMLGYLALIIEARMEYKGEDGWLGYDHRFRQNAAASPDTTGARIDPTLWNMAFVGQAKVSRCKHCFSLTHTAANCNWAPSPSTSLTPKQPTAKPTSGPRPSKICYEWNHSPLPTCPFPACKYQHISWYCSKDPQATDISHKALFGQRRCPARYAPTTQPANPTPCLISYQRYRPY